MSIVDRNQLRRVIVITALCFAMIFLTAYFLFIRGIDSIKPVYILNVGIDIIGMVVGYVIFICCTIDAQKNGVANRYLMLLLNAAFVGCFTDACAWLVDGVPGLRWLNIADNTVYYMCAPLEACFFWLYTMTYLKLDNKFVRRIGRYVVLGLILPVGIRLINLLNGIYFTVSAENYYQRSDTYLLSMVYSMVTLILALAGVVFERKKLQTFQIVTFFSYAVVPIIVGVITAGFYGFSPTATTVMLIVLLIYGILNVNQGHEKAVADRDLAIASVIQDSVLPKDFLSEHKEFDLFASMTPAKEVGGDFYDFFMVDDDHIALVMADVSGKGIPAALFMMYARTLIKSRTIMGEEPAKVLYEVNNQMCQRNKMEMFVTVWLAVVKLSTGEGLAANAGHEHPVLRHKDGSFELVKYRHSPAVATMEDIPYKQHDFKLEPGDTLFVYTDGVTEATNSSNELFGEDRLLTSLNSHKASLPSEVLNDVSTGISEFVKDAKQFDDITMLAFTYNGADTEMIIKDAF